MHNNCFKNYIFFSLLILIQILFFSCASRAQTSKKKQDKPNIIVILVDDMGYSDLGCTGSEIQTPYLDAMAKNGALFTNAYNTSRCCPSRASLLTGQYQWDAGMGHMDTTKSTDPEYQGFLNDECITIAEALKENGYQTFMSGKWHLGSKERSMWPDKRGFDQYYGVPAGGGLYFYPSKFYKRDVYWNGKQVEPDSTWYSTDAFTDYAINYIKKDKEDNKPFFMYLAYIAPHFPLQAKAKDIDKYREYYTVGYDAVRRARFEKQKTLGIIPEFSLLPEPEHPDWNNVENKEEEALKMAVYAAMMDCLDQNIGRLMKSLEEEGLYEDTMVVFMSDNGGASTDFNKTPKEEIGTRNSNASYGKWYNVSNTPYRKAKAKEHEGGIITPMVVHWPKGLSNKGMLITNPVHIMDIMPTCLEISGTPYPKDYKGKRLDPLDGKSFIPMLNGHHSDTSGRLLFWEHEGNKAVREGDWKLVKLRQKNWELYNIKEDPFEQHNLAEKETHTAETLLVEYKKWAKKHGVQSWPLKK